MEAEILLTIGIPTYNRVSTLKECLESVVHNFRNRSVEIIVSDNCSSDGTEAYMREVTVRYPAIVYYRNRENLGMDGNFLHIFEKAKGKYVMLIGDDDVFLNEGIDSIFESIKKDPVLIRLNSYAVNASSQTLHNSIIEYTDKNAFLLHAGIMITYVSSLVFKTDYIREIENKQQYNGTYFLQSHFALRVLQHEGKYLYIPTYCCKAGPKKTVWYDLYHVWGKCFGDLLMKTGADCGFDARILETILYDALNKPIRIFIKTFRITCQNESSWNRNDLWLYVKDFPDLIRKYKYAMNAPKWLLKVEIQCRKIARPLWHMVRKLGSATHRIG